MRPVRTGAVAKAIVVRKIRWPRGHAGSIPAPGTIVIYGSSSPRRNELHHAATPVLRLPAIRFFDSAAFEGVPDLCRRRCPGAGAFGIGTSMLATFLAVGVVSYPLLNIIYIMRIKGARATGATYGSAGFRSRCRPGPSSHLRHTLAPSPAGRAPLPVVRRFVLRAGSRRFFGSAVVDTDHRWSAYLVRARRLECRCGVSRACGSGRSEFPRLRGA